MDKTLVVGMGEVGSALYKVLERAHEVYALDLDWPQEELETVDVMHICFPFSDDFEAQVRTYKGRYRPVLTVIHSTVPIGTSKGLHAVHSPVMGLHPDLGQSLRTFTKFVGGLGASIAARHLMRAGIRCYVTDKAETTEALKLWSTTAYGLWIEWTKEVKAECNKMGLPFEAVTLWTNAYNAGYQALGRPEYTRPNLVPMLGKIGGHCVLPNLKLVPDSPFVRLIKKLNE